MSHDDQCSPEVRPVVRLDESRIDAIFANLSQCHLPGVAVGIAHCGLPVYRKGFGLASMELPCVLSTATRMRIGSTSKQFTAFAYLLLCEDGVASLDNRLGDYFPDFSPAVRRVTMRQLLGHTSGIMDATEIRFRLGGFEGAPATTRQLLSLYRALDDVNAPPGSTWIYNNAGYILLGAAVEKLCKQSLQDFLWKRVFSPIGMYDTLIRSSDAFFTPHTATPHTLMRDGGFRRRFWGLEFAGAGDVLSTVDDLLRWLAHMKSPVIGNRATWETMLSPQTLSNGTSTGYGGGLIRNTYRGLETVNHGGGWIGGNAQALKVPTLDLDVVVISNRSDIFSPVLAYQIIDASVSGLEPKLAGDGQSTGEQRFSVYRSTPVRIPTTPRGSGNSSTPGEHLTGLFRSSTTERIVQLFPEHGMQIVSIDAHDLPYERDGHGNLAPIPVWSHIRRYVELPPSDGAVPRIRLWDFGEPDELTRVEPKPTADASPLQGDYRASGIDAVARIILEANGPRLRFDSPFGSSEYHMTHLCEHSWRISCPDSFFLDAILVFSEAHDAFRIFAYNVRGFRFSRGE
ncbi:MAG TPA: serine hydrolase domain-containing protein [Steroidobacteraceae bacterium]